MSTAVFVAVSAANASAAQQAAHQAMIERCTIEVDQFSPSVASTQQKQSYAECINALYPKELTGGEIVVWKVFIVLVLVGLIAGLIKGWKSGEGFGWVFVYGCAGAIFAAVGSLFLALAFAGIAFLFAA